MFGCDSSSALDYKTDAALRAVIATELKDSTSIIIAQRVSSVQDADIILIMDNGQIVAQGNHDELLKSSSIYQEVYYSQQKGGDE